MITLAKLIVGWVFLIVGVLLIAWVLYSSYNICTAKTDAPDFFKAEEVVAVSQGSSEDIQAQIQNMIGEQLKGFLPTDSIPKLLNLIVWSILAGIMIFGGSQFAGLGIKLMKA